MIDLQHTDVQVKEPELLGEMADSWQGVENVPDSPEGSDSARKQGSVRKCSSFILLQVVDQFSQHHLLKRLPITRWMDKKLW